MKYTLLLLSIGTLALTGCYSTIGEPAQIDPTTGKIKTQSIYGTTEAVVIKSERVDMKVYRELILTLGGDFFRDQTKNLNRFKEVTDREQMEKLLIRENLDTVVPDVTNYLSWKRIADNYKPFLVLKPDTREEGRNKFFQLKAIRADTAEEVFVSEVKLDYLWKGVSDDTVFYPLYNSFIEWVNANMEASGL